MMYMMSDWNVAVMLFEDFLVKSYGFSVDRSCEIYTICL